MTLLDSAPTVAAVAPRAHGVSVCIGAEGAGTAINNSQGALGSLWSAMPFVGLHFGSRSIEAGLRAGFGFAYGGRESVRTITDRSGPGVAAQAFAEVAVIGATVDFIGRIGLRYTRVAWANEPAQVLYPTENAINSDTAKPARTACCRCRRWS